MNTKEQMKQIFSLILTASQARENSQSNVPEHTIVSSILIDLIFRRNQYDITNMIQISLHRYVYRVRQVNDD